jgi:hypothetical protein
MLAHDLPRALLEQPNAEVGLVVVGPDAMWVGDDAKVCPALLTSPHNPMVIVAANLQETLDRGKPESN